ncbi:MAG: tetratricopeptide repeat protein [Raineya sp.]|jgi:tetratricopeptide (TPR) repeat protein|nr:tetratricopeptide repeat protein [Raineya sp.]
MKWVAFCIALGVLSVEHAFAQKKKKKDKEKDKVEETESQARTEEIVGKDDRQTTLMAERQMLEGMKYYALDNYLAALENFQKALKINPKSSGIHYQIAETYLKAGRPNDAIAYAEKAIDLEDTNKYYYLLLGKLYESQGQYEEAAKTYEKMFSKKITGTDLYAYDLAQIYQFRIKDYSKALKLYENLEKKYGVQEALSKAKQLIYIEQKNNTAATLEAEKLAKAFPENSGYQINYAEMLLASGEESKAESFLVSKLPKDYSFSSHFLLYRIYKKQNKKDLANDLLSKTLAEKSLPDEVRNQFLKENTQGGGDVTQMNNELEKAVQNAPQDPETWWLYAKSLEQKKDLEKARNAYFKVVSLDGNRFEAWQKLLYLDTELMQATELLSHSEQALELYPTQAIFWLYNGIAYHESKKYPKAIESYEQGLSFAKNNAKLQTQLNIRLADTYYGMGQYEKSDKVFEDILVKEPENVVALNNYSYYLASRKQKMDIATKHVKKLLELQPENGVFVGTYGWVLYKQNKLQDAKKMFEKAVSLAPSALILEHYGDVLFKLNEKDKAIEQWQKAQNMKGGSPQLAKKVTDKQLYE